MRTLYLLFVALCINVADVDAKSISKLSQLNFSDAEVVTLYLDSAGCLQERMADVDTSIVKKLVISGAINSDDILYLRSLTSLISIDMGGISRMEHGTQPYYSFNYHKISPGYTNHYYLADCDSTWSSDPAFAMGGSTGKVYSPSMHYAFYQLYNLKEIVLPSKMTELGRNILSRTHVEHVVLPDGVKKIHGGAFYECVQLKYLDGLEHVVEIVGHSNSNSPGGIDPTFGYCSNLVGNSTNNQIDLSHLDTIPNYIFDYCSQLSSVMFSSSLKYIGGSAFNRCSSLETLVLPETIEFIGEAAFNSCSQLSSVTIPNTIKRLYYNSFSGTPFQNALPLEGGVYYLGNLAIGRQPNMTTLSFREGTTYIIEGFQSVSKDNNNITSVSFPSSLKRIGDNFFNNTNLTSIDFPEGLEEIGSGTLKNVEELSLPSSLKSISLSLSKVKSLTIPESMEYISLKCPSLEALYYYARHVRSISSTLNSLKSLFIGKNVSYVPYIGSAPSLNTVDFETRDSSDTICIGNEAFCHFPELYYIQLPYGVTTIGESAFRSWKSPIDLPSTLKYIGKEAFCNSHFTYVTFPEGLLSIGEKAFYNSAITSLVIPKTLTYLGKSAFEECQSLETVTWKTTHITDIPDFGFKDCNILKKVTGLSGVKNIGNYAFSECALKTFSMPTTLETIGECAFRGSENKLSTVYLGQNVKRIGAYAFNNTGLTNLTIANPRNIEDIGLHAFLETPFLNHLYETSGSEPIYLQSILLASGSKSYLEVKEGTHLIAGGACSNVQKITLPSSLRYVGSSAFSRSTIRVVEIPEGVERIGDNAFYGCYYLQEIVLPSTLKYIGKSAFALGIQATAYSYYGADYVLYCGAMTPPVSENSIFTNPDYIISYEHRVPEEAVEAYAAAPYWSDFSIIGEPVVPVTVNNVVREYAEDNPEFVFETEVEGEPEISCDADRYSPAGVYPIKISKGSLRTYRPQFSESTLTVAKAPLTIETGTYKKRQGEKMPTFKLTYTGFKNNETKDVLTKLPIISCEADETSEPGEYPIIISGAEAQNYDFNYIEGKLIVQEAFAISFTAKSYTRDYGEENPTFEYTTFGARPDGVPEITCEATVNSPVGEYPIIITKGGVKNYNDTYINGTLTITKAPLKASVGNYSREQGQENPAFTISYSGWKNNENESVLLKKPVATTEATKDSPVGEYAIIISGGEAQNYEFEYVDGTLTVTVPLGIEALLASGQPFDVYTTTGVKVKSQVTTLKGLPRGVYIINKMKVFVR